MTRIAMVVTSVIGLAFAIVEAVLLPSTITVDPGATTLGLLVGILGAVTAGVAGRLILGTRSVHNYFKLSLPVLTAISGFAFVSALTDWLISRDVVFGPPPAGVRGSVIIALVVGAAIYFVAAFVYGFAGTRQGVRVGARVGLLVLLLASVLPYLNLLGFVGWLIVSALRKPVRPELPTDDASPEPAAASE